MMRVLFADIDGVFNSEDFFARQRGRGLTIISDRAELIDPAAVAHLNRIVEATGCLVVLSSSWRLERGALLNVTDWLRRAGFVGTLFDLTPRAPATRGESMASVLFLASTRDNLETGQPECHRLSWHAAEVMDWALRCAIGRQAAEGFVAACRRFTEFLREP